VTPVRRTFPGEKDQIACARDFVKRAAGCCPMLDEAVLLTSELCTNTLQHTASGRGGSFGVTVYRGRDSLRVEVRDDGSKTVPAIRGIEQLPEDGLGLELVDLIASRWGYNGDEYGRSVFFELRWNCLRKPRLEPTAREMTAAQADRGGSGN
jgi:anti-sigma regulatory factor (Ser/Thr protein kinase)